MNTLKESRDKVLEADILRSHNVPPKLINKIIDLYQDALIETLLENGHLYITQDFRVDIVATQPRRYVLRGQEYSSNRVYKLKASIGDPIYEKIREMYDQFREGV